MSALAAPIPMGNGFIRSSSGGAGDDASSIDSSVANAIRHLLNSITFGSNIRDATDQLFAIRSESADTPGEFVSPDSAEIAQRFFLSLPSTVPPPHVAVDPDGEVALDWHGGPGRAFTISISRDGMIYYASLAGITRSRGRVFFGETIPQMVLDEIQNVVS